MRTNNIATAKKLKILAHEYAEFWGWKTNRFNEVQKPPKQLTILAKNFQAKHSQVKKAEARQLQFTDKANDQAAETKYLCVVGSRESTPYGKLACEHIIKGLAGYPITIVSGLAIGLDAYAHHAALDAGLKTIAFPGSGLNESVLYPKSNHYLAEQILESGGMLVSEFEDGFKATQWGFHARNRLMAAISDAVLIIEAGMESGTLITARFGLEYGRDVCVVPGPIFSDASLGALSLLKDGAHAITSPSDILSILGLRERKEKAKKSVKSAATAETTIGIPSWATPEERKILSALKCPLSQQELQRITCLPIPIFLASISNLEIRGMIKESRGLVMRT